jgi:hypothetical protein
VKGNDGKTLIDDGHIVVPVVSRRVFFIIPGSSECSREKAFKNSYPKMIQALMEQKLREGWGRSPP